MFSRRAVQSLLAAVAWLALLGEGLANVLEVIPSTALAVVLVNRLDATSDKIQKLAGKVGAPPIPLLMLARMQTGIQEGLDEKGSAAIAILPAEGQPGAPIVVLPVSDYAKFLAQLQPEDAKAKIAQVTLAGESVLVCQHGHFAILATPEQKDALESVLESVNNITDVLTPLTGWLVKVDLACVVTPAGIKSLSIAAGGPLAAAGGGQALPQAPGIGSVLPLFQAYQPMFATVGDQLRVVAIGARIEETGTVRATIGLRFKPGGTWSTIASRMAAKNKSLLAGLPRDPLVAAGAIQFSAPLHELAPLLFGAGPEMPSPLLAGLAPEEQIKFGAAASQMWNAQQSQAIWLGATKPGEPLLARGVIVSKVDDPKKFLTQFEAAWNQLKLPAGDGLPRLVPGVIRHIQVDDRKVLEIVGSARQIDDAEKSLGPEGQSAAVRWLGPSKEVHGYVAAIDDHTVVWAYGSQDNLRQAIAAAAAGSSESGTAFGMAGETVALLPSGVQAALLLELSALADWIERLGPAPASTVAAKIDFPPAPPVGLSLKFAGSGIKLEAVVPEATVAALGKLIAKMQHARAPVAMLAEAPEKSSTADEAAKSGAPSEAELNFGDLPFATPERTFKTAQRAVAREKFADFAGCFSDDGLSELAGTSRLIAAMLASATDANENPAVDRSRKSARKAIDQYIPADGPATEISLDGSGGQLRAAVRKSGREVKDRVAFVAAVLGSLMELDPAGNQKTPFLGAKLLNLKIDNETATATASQGLMDASAMPIAFRLVKGQWKIDSIGSFGIGEGTEHGEAPTSIKARIVVPGCAEAAEKMTPDANPPGSVPPVRVRVPAPKLKVEQPTFDFGEAESGETIKHTFVLANTGDKPLTIAKFVPLGAMLMAGPLPREIGVGRSVELKITTPLAGQRGRVKREIVVHSDDPAAPQFTLSIVGKAVPRAKVEPARVDVGTVQGQTPASKTFKVTGERGLTFNIVETRGTSGESVAATVKVVKPGKEYEVTATVTLPAATKEKPLQIGDFKGWIHLITDQKGEYHVIGVPVVAQVQGEGGK